MAAVPRQQSLGGWTSPGRSAFLFFCLMPRVLYIEKETLPCNALLQAGQLLRAA